MTRLRLYEGTRRDDEITVSLDARNWESATNALLNCKRNQPDGYTLIAAKIVRRGTKGGKRCQLHLVLRHTNLAHPPITQEEAGDLFSTEIRLALDRGTRVEVFSGLDMG